MKLTESGKIELVKLFAQNQPSTAFAWLEWKLKVEDEPPVLPGISLRDWFAGQERLLDVEHPDSTMISMALATALAGEPPPDRGDPVAGVKWEAKWKAALRYLRADAMLEAREGDV